METILFLSQYMGFPGSNVSTVSVKTEMSFHYYENLVWIIQPLFND